MLHSEPNNHYEIYPSWADYKVKWHELPRLLADPLQSGLLDANDLQSVEDGTLPSVPAPFEMIDGPAGGGIMITTLHRPPGLNWCVRKSFAEISAPMGVNFEVSDNQAQVAYMQPSRSLSLGLGERRPKVYDRCAISFDHTESAGDQIYWFAGYETGKKQLAGLDAVPQLAAGFGLTVQRLPQPPDALAAETADWGWREGDTYDWYIVQGGRDGIGFQYAVIVYIGLHLCKVAGRRFNGLHLTAQLESKTRFRKTLAERRAAFDADCQEAESDLRRNNPAKEPSREEIVTLVCERRTQRDWQSHGFVVKGQIGAATVQELIERYREAHRHQDVESLRSLYIQTAAGHSALTLEKDERPLSPGQEWLAS
jgi:hypothetical protein